jgi:hypothetical protein
MMDSATHRAEGIPVKRSIARVFSTLGTLSALVQL